MRFFAAAAVVLAVAGCKIEKLPPAGPSSDDFNRAALGDAWANTGANWRIDNGELVIDHAYNHPLWLKKPIPRDAVIELDCWSNDDAGDLKIEAWGDGKSFAQTASYTATSYVFIFGGWHNQISAIARMNEHGADRKTRTDLRVEKGKKYHWRIAQAKRPHRLAGRRQALPELDDAQSARRRRARAISASTTGKPSSTSTI